MKSNMGKADRGIRVIIFIVALILLLTGIIGGTLGYVIMTVATVLLVTSFINFCPLYTIFGINTKKK